MVATSQKYLCSAFLWLLGSVFLACSLASVVSDDMLFGALWPADINGWAVFLLGADTSKDVLGSVVYSVTAGSIWWRLAVMTALAGAVVFSTSGSGRMNTALGRVGIVWVVSSLWWALYIGSVQFGSTNGFRLSIQILPMWLMMTAAVTVWLLLREVFSAVSSSSRILSSRFLSLRLPSWIPFATTVGIAAAWVGLSYGVNERLYAHLLIPHGDSAMYEEHLWNIWHGKGFRSYLDQGLFLGEHIQVVHLLLLPIHVLWPSHLMLELAESVALGICVIPLFRMARRHGGDSWAAMLLSLAWLLYFPMHFLDVAIDQKTFRPIVLGLPFLFWAIELAERRRFRTASLCLLIVLCAKEDFALITIPLGCVFAFRSSFWLETGETQEAANARRRWGFGVAMLSLIYLLLAVTVIIPAFRSGDVVHYSRYFGDLGSSPGDLIRNSLADPIPVLRRLLSAQTLFYGFVFLGPVALMGCRSPLPLLSGTLTFLMLALLQFTEGDQPSAFPPVPYHHFHAPLLPVIFWASARALGAGSSPAAESPSGRRGLLGPFLSAVFPADTSSRGWAGLVFLCCLCTSITNSYSPLGARFWSATSAAGYQVLSGPAIRGEAADMVVSGIPSTAHVASTDYIHTRLTHVERSYDYSAYRRAVNDYRAGVPDDTDYIVIDTDHRHSVIRKLEDVPEWKQHPERWHVVADGTDDLFIVLRRR